MTVVFCFSLTAPINKYSIIFLILYGGKTKPINATIYCGAYKQTLHYIKLFVECLYRNKLT